MATSTGIDALAKDFDRSNQRRMDIFKRMRDGEDRDWVEEWMQWERDENELRLRLRRIIERPEAR